MKAKKTFLCCAAAVLTAVTVSGINQSDPPVTTVSASAAERTVVVPSGSAVGVCIYTEGLLVTGTTAISDEGGNAVNAAENADIKKGDRILSVDGNEMNTIESFTKYVNEHPNQLALTLARGKETIHTLLTPVKTSDGYKIGVWVRDSTAGIGTVTYYNPADNSFAALGHGIADIDTGDILSVREGNILPCTISIPTKGEKGTPGELNGSFTYQYIGRLNRNLPIGIYGTLSNTEPIHLADPVSVALPGEVHEGGAYILADVDGAGVQSYQIEIKKVNTDNKEGKNLVIKVTDPVLMEKTGGIVQGMSGAPIVQNGMLAGAVTHVFVNDPLKGYGILADAMIHSHS